MPNKNVIEGPMSARGRTLEPRSAGSRYRPSGHSDAKQQQTAKWQLTHTHTPMHVHTLMHSHTCTCTHALTGAHTCACVCSHTRTHTLTCTFTHMHSHVHPHRYAHAHTLTRTYTHTCTHPHTCTDTHVCTHPHTRMHTHTITHTHAHTAHSLCSHVGQPPSSPWPGTRLWTITCALRRPPRPPRLPLAHPSTRHLCCRGPGTGQAACQELSPMSNFALRKPPTPDTTLTLSGIFSGALHGTSSRGQAQRATGPPEAGACVARRVSTGLRGRGVYMR